jgi:hypothetical protein
MSDLKAQRARMRAPPGMRAVVSSLGDAFVPRPSCALKTKRPDSRRAARPFSFAHLLRSLRTLSTAAQFAANKLNAQSSTGPKSATGKAKVSLNAIKTGRTVILPSEDVAVYREHVARYEEKYTPAGPEEAALVQALVDTEWRLLRIPSLEAGIFAIGYVELASQFDYIDGEAARRSFIEAKIFLTYRRDLNNLSIQESRLRHQFEKDRAALNDLQTRRKQDHEKKLNQAANEFVSAACEKREFDQHNFGFEFSTEEIEYRAHEINPSYGRKRPRRQAA